MKCYILDNKLKRHDVDIKQVINEPIKAICLYLKNTYGIGSFYLEGNEDITIVIDKREIRYFKYLC